MIDLSRAIVRTLREDPILQEVVGFDKDNEVKVYAVLAKSDVSPPYVSFDVIPANQIVGVYGDDEVIEPFPVNVKAWGRDPREAWQLAAFVADAIGKGQFSFEPYSLAQFRRTSNGIELGDRDTNMTQVVVQYDVILAR